VIAPFPSVANVLDEDRFSEFEALYPTLDTCPSFGFGSWVVVWV